MRISDWSSDVCSSDLMWPDPRIERLIAGLALGAHLHRPLMPQPEIAQQQKRYQRGDQDVAQDESDAILTKRKLPMHVAAETIGQIRDHGGDHDQQAPAHEERSEEHTSELQSLMRISYAVFCLKKKKQ